MRIERGVVGERPSLERSPTVRDGAGATDPGFLRLETTAASRVTVPGPGAAGIMGRWRNSTHPRRRLRAPPTEAAGSALQAFAVAALELVGGDQGERALAPLLRAVALGTGAELVVARLADNEGRLVARGVDSGSTALAAELQGTQLAAAEAPAHEVELEDAAGDPAAPPRCGG